MYEKGSEPKKLLEKLSFCLDIGEVGWVKIKRTNSFPKGFDGGLLKYLSPKRNDDDGDGDATR